MEVIAGIGAALCLIGLYKINRGYWFKGLMIFVIGMVLCYVVSLTIDVNKTEPSEISQTIKEEIKDEVREQVSEQVHEHINNDESKSQ